MASFRARLGFLSPTRRSRRTWMFVYRVDRSWTDAFKLNTFVHTNVFTGGLCRQREDWVHAGRTAAIILHYI